MLLGFAGFELGVYTFEEDTRRDMLSHSADFARRGGGAGGESAGGGRGGGGGDGDADGGGDGDADGGGGDAATTGVEDDGETLAHDTAEASFVAHRWPLAALFMHMRIWPVHAPSSARWP